MTLNCLGERRKAGVQGSAVAVAVRVPGLFSPTREPVRPALAHILAPGYYPSRDAEVQIHTFEKVNMTPPPPPHSRHESL